MQAALDQFKKNIDRVRNLQGIYHALSKQTSSVLDLTDLLRASLVMSVSALDHYIHETVRLGMLESWRGNRPKISSFLHFSISLDSASKVLLNQPDEQWLDDEIRERHKWQSFQNPERITEALRLVTAAAIWDAIAADLGRSVQDVKQQFELIIDRRNKIAHEADMDPSFPNLRWPIDETVVNKSVGLIVSIAETIHRVI
jgi:hypothetical protein